MMDRKVEVGQELWLVDAGNRARYNKGARPCVVVKVGRKYFDVEWGDRRTSVTFHIDTWREKTEYTPGYRLFRSEAAYQQEAVRREWNFAFSGFFRYGSPEITIEQYEKAAEILGIRLEEDK